MRHDAVSADHGVGLYRCMGCRFRSWRHSPIGWRLGLTLALLSTTFGPIPVVYLARVCLADGHATSNVCDIAPYRGCFSGRGGRPRFACGNATGTNRYSNRGEQGSYHNRVEATARTTSRGLLGRVQRCACGRDRADLSRRTRVSPRNGRRQRRRRLRALSRLRNCRAATDRVTAISEVFDYLRV